MRLFMVVFACSTALSAQVVETDAAVKLKQFENNLANAMRQPDALRKALVLSAALPPVRECAIPLLSVKLAPEFHSNMPVITPDSKTDFAARQVTPPAPACDEPNKND